MRDAVTAAEKFVKGHLAELAVDSSHDWWHIHRVRNLALEIGSRENLPEPSLAVVEFAALLHDIKDWKYSKDAVTGADAVKEFLDSAVPLSVLSETHRQEVVHIVRHIGFKDELGAPGELPISKEFCVVQDADRLDAIGAVGIARCLTFGGRFDRVLHDPHIPPRENLTKEQYTSATAKQTTINHFHEKLLRLKGMMKTEAGRSLALARHQYMEAFLERFHAEWEGKA